MRPYLVAVLLLLVVVPWVNVTLLRFFLQLLHEFLHVARFGVSLVAGSSIPLGLLPGGLVRLPLELLRPGSCLALLRLYRCNALLGRGGYDECIFASCFTLLLHCSS